MTDPASSWLSPLRTPRSHKGQKQLELKSLLSNESEERGCICIWLVGPHKNGHAPLTRRNTAEEAESCKGSPGLPGSCARRTHRTPARASLASKGSRAETPAWAGRVCWGHGCIRGPSGNRSSVGGEHKTQSVFKEQDLVCVNDLHTLSHRCTKKLFLETEAMFFKCLMSLEVVTQWIWNRARKCEFWSSSQGDLGTWLHVGSPWVRLSST